MFIVLQIKEVQNNKNKLIIVLNFCRLIVNDLVDEKFVQFCFQNELCNINFLFINVMRISNINYYFQGYDFLKLVLLNIKVCYFGYRKLNYLVILSGGFFILNS